ncbi:MAG: DUF2303 family protein [Rhodospirillaceae bacterium]
MEAQNTAATRYSAVDVGALLEKFGALIEDNQKPSMIALPDVAGLPVPANLHAVLLPKGRSVVSLKSLLDDYLERPERICANATVLTLDSFADYMIRFYRDDSAVFIDNGNGRPSMVGLIDYHGQGASAAPSFCTHSVRYDFPLSPQFAAWQSATARSARAETLMTQAEFAEFLQDREFDLENPPVDWSGIPEEELRTVFELLNIRPDIGATDDRNPALLPAVGTVADSTDERPLTALDKLRKKRFGRLSDLNTLARGIEISVGQKFSQAVDPRTGERTVSFAEEHSGAQSRDGRKITVPELFLIYIPVFDAAPPQLLPVRLFYRTRGDSLKWGVQLIDTARLVRRAVEAAADKLHTDTALPVYFGRPGLSKPA